MRLYWQIQRDGLKVFETLGIKSIKEARKMDAVTLCQTANPLKRFVPVIDGYVLKNGIVTNIMKNEQHKIDYMIGAAANEGWCNPVNTDVDALKAHITRAYQDEADNYMKEVIGENLENIYMAVKDREGAENNAAPFAWDELELSRGGKVSYHYLFSMPALGDESGAFHSSEHMYVFQTMLRHNWRTYSGKDFDLSNIMCSYWTNFVKKGDPNGEGLPKWTKYNGGREKAMELGNYVGMIDTLPLRDSSSQKIICFARQKNIIEYFYKIISAAFSGRYLSKLKYYLRKTAAQAKKS